MFNPNNIFSERSLLQNYFKNIQTPNRFENRNVIRYNLRIFTGIFSAYIRQKNNNIQPPLGKQHSYKKCVSAGDVIKKSRRDKKRNENQIL